MRTYYLYILYNTKDLSPVYVGLSNSLKSRIKYHKTKKKFDGVMILEKFQTKIEGLAAERTLIKFLSAFRQDSIVNGLYVRYSCVLYGDPYKFLNRIKDIEKGIYS